jgi:hypothetical protein
MDIATASVTLLDNFAPIGVTCSKQASKNCFGTVDVQVQTLALAIVDGQPTAKAVRLGRESYAIPRGRTERVLVGLSKRAVKAVKKAGRLRVTVVLTARDSAGKRANPLRKKVWLKSKAKAKSKPTRP